MHAPNPVPGQARLLAPAKKAPAARAAAAPPRTTARRPTAAALTLQRLAGNAAVRRLVAARQRDTVLTALRTAGRPLSEPVRADMEARLGADLSGVRVHTDSAADRAARAVAAEAFTTGSHLVFRQGRYNPGSAPGRRVLAHELVHVLQQRHGPVAGSGARLRISDPGDRFERAAETVARRAMGRPGEPASARPARSPVTGQSGPVPGNLPVQRAFLGQHSVQYGGRINDCGTEMIAELHKSQLAKGSSPSVRPKWWNQITQVCKSWFARFMVQGHLLNEKLGGPGNTMDNLTPITKSANKKHHDKVEAKVKKEVLQNNNVVEYYVKADYSTHPDGDDMAPNEPAQVVQDIDLLTPNMAGMIEAEYTVYDAAGNDLGGGRWEIQNDSLP